MVGAKKRTAISRHENGNRQPDLETALAYEILFQDETKKLFPGLYARVQGKVKARLVELAGKLREKARQKKRAFLLAKLARLEAKVSEAAPAV